MKRFPGFHPILCAFSAAALSLPGFVPTALAQTPRRARVGDWWELRDGSDGFFTNSSPWISGWAQSWELPASLTPQVKMDASSPSEQRSEFPLTATRTSSFPTTGSGGSHPQAIETPSDGTNGDDFGYAVSLSGTIGLVGAYQATVNGNNQGAAYVYRNLDTASGTVTEDLKLTASDGVANDGFGFVVSLSGTTGLVAAPGVNATQGAAYVFRNLDTATNSASGTVNENIKLTASDGVANDAFSYSVSLSGTTGLVGAPNAAIGANAGQGAAYVFRNLDTANGTVTENAKLTASDGAGNDFFGYAVSLSGTTGLVGAPNAAIGANAGQGAAYVFRNLDAATNSGGGTVTENIKLTASDGATNDGFGYAVSLSGTTGLVGAPAATVGFNPGQGAAYVFRNLDTATNSAGGSLNENVKLTASDGAGNDGFGTAVSLSGTTGVIGSPYAMVNGNSSQGAAYVFRNLDTATNSASGPVNEDLKLTASDGGYGSLFGCAVSLDGDRFVIGTQGSEESYSGTISSMTTLDSGNATGLISGISFVSQTDWIIGANTSGNQVTLSAGDTANIVGGDVYVGQNAGSANNLLLIKGTLIAESVTLGSGTNPGAGNTLTLEPGANATIGELILNGASTVNNGIALTVLQLTGSADSQLVNTGSLIVGDPTDTIFAGTISGSGGLAKQGPGYLMLTGANTYTGGTSVNGGMLLASNASGSATGTGPVSVNSGGALGGNGTISGPVTVASGGALAPGTLAVSRLTLGSTLALQSGSTLVITLGGTTAGSGYDQVLVGGTLTLAGTLSVSTVNGFTLAPGETFTILDNTNDTALTTGTFSNAVGTLYTDLAGDTFLINYAANVDSGTVPNDVTLTYLGVNVVPEPTTWALVALGLAGLGVVTRRCRFV